LGTEARPYLWHENLGEDGKAICMKSGDHTDIGSRRADDDAAR
jgi:hypothetical protein